MIRRRDCSREVFVITPKDLLGVKSALAAMPPGIASDVAAERHVIGLLNQLPPDRAWWTAHKVRDAVVGAAGYERA
jgi:hypothetical protein